MEIAKSSRLPYLAARIWVICRKAWFVQFAIPMLFLLCGCVVERSSSAHELKLGMSRNEIHAAEGQPTEVSGNKEIWSSSARILEVDYSNDIATNFVYKLKLKNK